MEYQPEISFRGFEPNERLLKDIDERLAKLEEIYPRLVGCRMAVEQRNHSKVTGNLFHVRIELRVPGSEILISHDPSNDENYADMHFAVKKAFDAAERRLRSFEERRRRPS